LPHVFDGLAGCCLLDCDVIAERLPAEAGRIRRARTLLVRGAKMTLSKGAGQGRQDDEEHQRDAGAKAKFPSVS
jgi:hypothetical protein